MRKTLKIVVTSLILLWLSGVSWVFAQSETGRPFITKWKGEAGKELKIPIVGTEYQLVIKDESNNPVKEEKVTVTEGDSPYYTFTPDAEGIYTVEAGPEGVKYMRTRIEEPSSLREVVQFGTVKWESMKEMFQHCGNMIFASGIDTPDLSKVTNMSGMFYGCTSFNQPLDNWDVSNVTDMSWMFYGCTSFNQPLDKWKVGKVIDMSKMFYGCTSFNQPLDKWKVGKVTDMSKMFYGCTSFNQPLNEWDVSKVKDMGEMFNYSFSFNQPLDNWKVSKVTNMGGMFSECTSFNQSLDNWDVSKVTNMGGMFYGCSSFNQPLGKWKVSNVTNMGAMFHGSSAFNQPLNHWDVSKVTEMGAMFHGCSAFNQPLGKWKIKTAVGGLSTTAMSPSNYSQTLVGWAGQTDIAENLNFGVNVKDLIYNDKCKAARQKLIDKGWNFEGDTHQSSGVAITPHFLPLVLNRECTLPLEKWGVVGTTEEVTLSTDKGEIISYEMTADKKGVHITGLKEGKCQLTATIAAKAGVHDAYTSTCEIGVYIPIERITISPASKTLKVGEEFTFTVNFFPENATKRGVEWKWECYKTEIATVDDNGKVTAKKAGKCTVYVDINKYGRWFKGKCEVTVVDEIVPVASIAIPEKQTIEIGATTQLVAVVKPDNAEQGLVWSSSDPEIAMVSGGVVWGKKKGECTITVTSLDPNCAISKECKITVKGPKFPVTLTQPANGKIAIEGHGTATTLSVEQGTTLTVTETHDEGYKLKSLTAGKEDITNSKQFTVTAATEVKAVFEKQTFAVKMSVNDEKGGEIAISGAADLKAVEYGTELTVTVTKKEGYKLKSLTAGDEDITNSKQFTVKAATEVKAVFEQETFAVTTSVNNEAWGTIELTGASNFQAVAYGTELTVKVTEKEGYKLKEIQVNGKKIEGTTFVVKEASTVIAVFEKKTFAVTASVNDENGGSIELTGATDLKAVEYGTELTVKVTEYEGYKLKEIQVNGKKIEGTTFVVKEASTVIAVFEKKTFAVTASVNDEKGGAIAISGVSDLKAVAYGTELTVTVTENEGYKLKSLTAGDKDITETKKFTVKAATEVKAVFENKQGGAVEDALLAGIAVAPNPFASQLRILNPEGVVARYEVVNGAGIVVRSGALSEKELVLDTEALSAGVYFVRLETQNGARKSIAVSK